MNTVKVFLSVAAVMFGASASQAQARRVGNPFL
jgi:hypothetical protein